MRLPILAPPELSDEQRAFFEASVPVTEKGGFARLRTRRDDGALLGPWAVLMHAPRLGMALHQQLLALSAASDLPVDMREVAILTTAARFEVAYEIYAHGPMAEDAGLPRPVIEALLRGEAPERLESNQMIAREVARALLDGGACPEPLFDAAQAVFGRSGLIELASWVGLYAQLGMLLNMFDVRPEDGRTRDLTGREHPTSPPTRMDQGRDSS
jgi:4-carboxymuconolactone decarboxylase